MRYGQKSMLQDFIFARFCLECYFILFGKRSSDYGDTLV